MTFFVPECHSKYTEIRSLDIGLAISTIAMLFSITTNSLLLFAIIRSSSYKSKFYSIVFSIALADLIAGAVVTPFFMYLTYRFTKFKNIDSSLPTHLFHTLFFTVAAAAILNSALMSFDRYTFLLNPEIYTSSLSNKKQLSMILGIWIFSFLFALLQHLVDGSLYLVLFSSVLVILSGTAMIFTLISYYKYFNREFTTINNHPQLPATNIKSHTPTPLNVQHPIEIINDFTPSVLAPYLHVFPTDSRKPSDTPSVATIPGTTEDLCNQLDISSVRPSITSIESERHKRAPRSFLGKGFYESRIVLTLTLITAIYWMHYLPFIISSFYLYISGKNYTCSTVLLTQNIILFSALFSSGFRSFVFILRLSQPREAICHLFDRRRKRQRNYTLERDSRRR